MHAFVCDIFKHVHIVVPFYTERAGMLQAYVGSLHSHL